jgi:hypothetical protein
MGVFIGIRWPIQVKSKFRFKSLEAMEPNCGNVYLYGGWSENGEKGLLERGYESLGFWTQYVNFFLSCLRNKQVEGIGLEPFGHHFETHENGYLHGYP